MVMRTFRAIFVAAALVAVTGAGATTALADSSESSDRPNFGPNVYIFNPSMPQSDIQAAVDRISNQQVPNQFGTQRYALMFEPGTYGTKTDPLIFQVGYYTSVAGLGLSPNDVVINGAVDVFNQCFGPGNCSALVNFWRSLSNLTINPTFLKAPPAYAPPSNDPGGAGCDNSNEMWAVSQAAPMRRVHINGFITKFQRQPISLLHSNPMSTVHH